MIVGFAGLIVLRGGVDSRVCGVDSRVCGVDSRVCGVESGEVRG